MGRESVKLCRGFKSPLLNCSGKRPLSEFYDVWTDFDDGKSCYCKDCCEKIFKHYLKETDNNLKSAIFYTCAKIDIPFREELFDNLNKRIEEGRLINVTFSQYYNELKKSLTKKEVFKDFSATNFDINKIEGKTKSLEDQAKQLKEYKYKWGEQDSIEDYEFLERTYENYVKDIEELTVTQEQLYQDLSRDRLLLRKLSESGKVDNDTITKVQNRVNSLMKTLKIDNFESNQKRTLSEQSFIEKIKVMEQTKPMELYSTENEDYYDFTKRKKYYTDLVLRPLCNTLAGHKDFNIDLSDLEQYNLKGDR